MATYSYKGISIDKLLTLTVINNSYLAGAGTNIPKSPKPTYSFEKPILLNIKYKGTDISEYVTSYYKDYNTSGVITETLPIKTETAPIYGVNFKHISAYGWGGGGGGGGRGGDGRDGGGDTKSGGAGGAGGNGAFVAIERYPISEKPIEISVGSGGNGGYRGNDRGNSAGKGGDAINGNSGNASYIKINNITVINAPGGNAGVGGNAGTSKNNGDNGANGNTDASTRVNDYKGTLTEGNTSYPKRNGGNGGSGGANGDQSGFNGNSGFIRIYYHYS
jgi:hypothetical protein